MTQCPRRHTQTRRIVQSRNPVRNTAVPAARREALPQGPFTSTSRCDGSSPLPLGSPAPSLAQRGAALEPAAPAGCRVGTENRSHRHSEAFKMSHRSSESSQYHFCLGQNRCSGSFFKSRKQTLSGRTLHVGGRDACWEKVALRAEKYQP